MWESCANVRPVVRSCGIFSPADAGHRHRGMRLAARSLVAAACGSGGDQRETPEPQNSSSSLITPSPSTPTPTVDYKHPGGIIAIGHSGLTGEATGGTYEPSPRIRGLPAARRRSTASTSDWWPCAPRPRGHVDNEAQGGAPASALLDQARLALEVVPAPQLAIIQTVDDDIRCDGSNVGAVG